MKDFSVMIKATSFGQDEGIENDISVDDILSHDEEETEVDGMSFVYNKMQIQ